jgi:hypothetical protein
MMKLLSSYPHNFNKVKNLHIFKAESVLCFRPWHCIMLSTVNLSHSVVMCVSGKRAYFLKCLIHPQFRIVLKGKVLPLQA